MKSEQTVVTVVGLNHQTSPVEEREQLAFSSEEMAAAVARLGEALGGAVLLSTCNRTLSRLFHSAISAGKRARTETHIGRHAVSVGSAAVTLARNRLGDLAGKTVLVISAGSMGKLAARALAETGGAQIVVANRTLQRARELAAEMGRAAGAVALSDLSGALAGADIVISGTAADGFIVGPRDVQPVMAGRSGRGLLFIDIAVPRDIDPEVREIPGVHLFDIDDVEAVTASGANGREQEVERVEAIIEEEVSAFLDWWRSLDAVPVIAALRERADAIRRKEVERTLARLSGLDEESRQRIEAMTAAIVKKMPDRPIARLKDGVDKGLYMEALEDLCDLPTAQSHGTYSRGG